jgi:esterase/lipase superfamily enzyme
MPTPTLYEQDAIELFPALPLEKQATDLQVFYASGRGANPASKQLPYGNTVDSAVHLGTAEVIFGEGMLSWQELLQASTEANRARPVTIQLGRTTELAEVAKIPVPDDPDSDQLTPPAEYNPAQQPYFDRINAQLSRSQVKELIIYVHGTKVDFLNAVTLTAEIDHFTGRQFVTLAYDWSSHQNILDYLIGIDKRRAVHASYQFKNVLQLLAEHTDAEKIHVISYSAGGRVVSRALHQLALENRDLNKDELRKHFRIGTVIFAAADVEVDRFLSRLEDIASLSEQTVITISDADNVLENARKLMGGESRAGSAKAEQAEQAFIEKHQLLNVHIVDVSRHKELRGFDIEGHHYWYRHPWISSDLVLLLKYGAPPHERALTSSEEHGIWYFAPDYPDAVKAAAKRSIATSGKESAIGCGFNRSTQHIG